MRLARISLGRVTSASAFDTLLALLAAFAWHLVALLIAFLSLLGHVPYKSTDLQTALGWEYRTGSEVIAKNAFLLFVLLAVEWMLAYLLWVGVRSRQPHATTANYYFVCLWRACVLGTIVLPTLVAASLYMFNVPYVGLVIGVLYLIIAPAGLAPRILPTRQPWRPVCPECGHTVAYAVLPRCTECGEPYPSADRFYRRWAIPRVPWERTTRSWFFAYIQTMFMIVFRPGAAAWRLGTPARMDRAVWWAIAHPAIPLCVIAALLLVANARMSSVQTWAGVYPGGIVPADPPNVGSATSMILRLVAWTIAAIFYPVSIGLLLVAGVSKIQPAARRAMYKWTLYASALPIAILIGVIGVGLSLWVGYVLNVRVISARQVPSVVFSLFNTPKVVLLLVTAVYAIWWSIGLASQPYARRRGFVVFLLALAAYAATWWLALLALNTRGFGSLL